MRIRWAHANIFAITCTLSLMSCASAQLNYNTLDIASSVDVVVTGQVLSNLAKFITSPHAIPSQVALTSGTVTTNNSITPGLTSPLSISTLATNTIAQTGLSKTFTNAIANTRGNAGASLNATDQWTQTWGIAPLTDPDQLRRLRILYQFGTDQSDQQDLLCNYPIIQSKPTAAQPVISTVTYPTSDGKSVTVTIGAPPKAKKPTHYLLDCKTGILEIHPDPAFLNPPSCIICVDPGEGNLYLYVNRRLTNGWLKSTNNPFTIPPGAIQLGFYQNMFLYVETQEDLTHFYEFSLFILEATTQSATSATGQSAGKGSPTTTAPLLLAPPPCCNSHHCFYEASRFVRKRTSSKCAVSAKTVA